MVKLLIFCAFILNFGGVPEQDSIVFHPKSLFTELLKSGNVTEPRLLEIQIDGNNPDENKIPGKYYSVEYKTGYSPISFVYVGRVNSCRTGGCSANPENSGTGEHEYFDYFILFDSDITVRQVRVYNYQATHGQEITSKGWLKQFEGYDGNKSLQVGKDIDGISGATISVFGITADIYGKRERLHEILNSHNADTPDDLLSMAMKVNQEPAICCYLDLEYLTGGLGLE